MPRYLITIGNSQNLLAKTSHAITAASPRTAMTKAHEALLNARRRTETGKNYDYWSVARWIDADKRYGPAHVYKLP